MRAAGRYFDGLVAESRAAHFTLEGSNTVGSWIISAADDGQELGRWPAASIYEVQARKYQLRLGSDVAPPTARITFEGWETVSKLRAVLPALTEHRRARRWSETRLIAGATTVLAGIVGGYVYGVPFLAGPIAQSVPPEWETALGETAAAQVEASLAGQGGFSLCNRDPESLANTAIARFVSAATKDTAAAFPIHVTVARSEIPNAFAIPGGHIYYLSAMLEKTETADEFAGVLAHEIGHVVHRDSMEQLVSSAGTGLLIGFVLGDMTGLSVAGGLGSAIIDSRNSREAERDADAFSAATAQRLHFDPTALATLLQRVAGDDEFTATLALLSSHPLTAERRAALQKVATPAGSLEPVFTKAEWQAIKTMCGAVHGPTASGGAGVLPRAGDNKER